MTDVLRARGLSKSFDATAALAGVDLSIAAGEVHGLLGLNGAGKTTLLRILLGLIAPDAGSAELLGQPLSDLGSRPLEAVAGFVEDPSFYPYLSARENLTLLAQLDGHAAPARRRPSGRIADALAAVGLGERADDRVAGFSTGMRQRLGIAAALIRRPRLLLLDEPTSGLDPAGARVVAELVGTLAADGVAILLSSHQIGELERICSDYSVMRDGQIVWSGSAAELERQAPASAYMLQTSDDARVLAIASTLTEAVRAEPGRRGGLTVMARPASLDRLVTELARAGVLIRRLEWLVSPLESMFFALTGDAPAELAPDDYAERVLARR